MNNTSPLDLLDSRPLPALVVELLRHVAETANASNVEWFVGGATARDIMLTHVHGIEATRATADVDIGVSVESWTGHAALKAALIAGGAFEQRNEAHRLYYRAPRSGELMWLDIVPFGGVESDGGKAAAKEIAWPPDHAIRMNVAGFAEALAGAMTVRVATDLAVPVASLPAQAMLKIVAWRDRHASDRKDATDLLFLLGNYAAAGNHARLYDESYELVEQYDHQLELAGAALLGRDTAAIASAETTRLIAQVLAFGENYPRILEHMIGRRARLFEPTPAFIESAFNAFREGFGKPG
ncbi:nucleotidyl transferase AbiEii/AbiGii toxin family protein [Paraburkholderia sp. RL17-337-BIB-A]|uniref:nucleotidyl transferase AbiEii/AbiGii toxin family protein n=1 Tax=Paraburkholderia sp. RL17-337-BIB-A TaxID=3031636 RepID=UPI0038B6D527